MTQKEKKPINSFVANIVNKDYKQANVSLSKMIEDKLKQRIIKLNAEEQTS